MSDALPVISQLKSLTQYVCGDGEGAARTQRNFLDQCPIVSQCASAVDYFYYGDEEAAKERQKKCGSFVWHIADAVPVVGHAKGVAHYIWGDKDGGDQCMKAASRTVGVIAGGAGGFVVAGPAGAYAGGIAGGQATDVITTAADWAITGKYHPSGTVGLVDHVARSSRKSDSRSGAAFDLVVTTLVDGVVGGTVGADVGATAKNLVGGKKPQVNPPANAIRMKLREGHKGPKEIFVKKDGFPRIIKQKQTPTPVTPELAQVAAEVEAAGVAEELKNGKENPKEHEKNK